MTLLEGSGKYRSLSEPADVNYVTETGQPENQYSYVSLIKSTDSYHLTMMSFELKNAPFCFSRLMDRILKCCEAALLR